MSAEKYQPSDDVLDRAVLQLRQMSIIDAPPELLKTTTVAALTSHSPTKNSANFWRTKGRNLRIASYGGLAATIVCVMIGAGVFWISDQSVSRAFAQAVEKVNAATSGSFEMEVTSEPKPGKIFHHRSKVCFQGDLIHDDTTEIDGASPPSLSDVSIWDLAGRTEFHLDYRRKVASKSKVNDRAVNYFRKLPEGLRNLGTSEAEYSAEDRLNGRKTLIYKLKKHDTFEENGKLLKDGETATVWIDAETSMPVQYLLETLIQGSPKSKPFINRVLMTGFDWNKPIDPKFFQIEVPEGFKLVDSTATGEKSE